MKRFLRKKAVILLVLVCFTLPTFQCGLILYPERNGQKQGDIDVRVLVMDCLWLIVGVVPGVVALVVDFATGCIYEPGKTGEAPKAKPGQKLSLNLRGPAPADADLMVTLTGKDRPAVPLLARHFQQGEEKFGPLTFAMPKDLAAGDYELAILVNGVENAAWPVEVTD